VKDGGQNFGREAFCILKNIAGSWLQKEGEVAVKVKQFFCFSVF
jgi:hypothetical protein